MLEQKIKENTQRVRTDLEQVEQVVKQWEKKFIIEKFNKSCKDCYDAFVDLKCDLAQTKDGSIKEKYEKICYQITSDLLSVVECNWEPERFIYVYKSVDTEPFKQLWDCLSDYCKSIEAKYPWAQV